MTCLKQIKRALRKGDRLVHDGATGLWSLLRAETPIEATLAEALRRDKRLGLQPGGDCLPGFPAEWGQTWACRPRPARPVQPTLPIPAAP